MQEREFSNRKDEKITRNTARRIFKTQLGDSNEILCYAMKVLRFLPISGSEDYQETPRNHNPSNVIAKQTEGSDFMPRGLVEKKKKSSFFKLPFKDDPIKLRDESFSLTNFSRDSRTRKLSEIRQAEVHFSLQRLALMVKMYMEDHNSTAIENIYMHILLKYFDTMCLSKAEADQLLCNIRRRICEVLRVFDGVGVINIERKMACLTNFGKLKGRGLFRQERKRRDALLDKKKELTRIIELRNQLYSKVQMFQALLSRNSRLLSLEEQGISCFGFEEKVFELPMIFIAGPPKPKLNIFRPLDVDQFRSVSIDRESGRILIRGDNLRVVQVEEVLGLVPLD